MSREALDELGNHSRVQFEGDDLARLVEKQMGEISVAGADFKDNVGGGDSGLVDDVFDDFGVVEEVLAFGFLHEERSFLDDARGKELFSF